MKRTSRVWSIFAAILLAPIVCDCASKTPVVSVIGHWNAHNTSVRWDITEELNLNVDGTFAKEWRAQFLQTKKPYLRYLETGWGRYQIKGSRIELSYSEHKLNSFLPNGAVKDLTDLDLKMAHPFKVLSWKSIELCAPADPSMKVVLTRK